MIQDHISLVTTGVSLCCAAYLVYQEIQKFIIPTPKTSKKNIKSYP